MTLHDPQPVMYIVYINDGSYESPETNIVATTTKEAAMEAKRMLLEWLWVGLRAATGPGPEQYYLANEFIERNPLPWPIDPFLDGWAFSKGWDVEIEEIPAFCPKATP